jgi:hypothetical protein
VLAFVGAGEDVAGLPRADEVAALGPAGWQVRRLAVEPRGCRLL